MESIVINYMHQICIERNKIVRKVRLYFNNNYCFTSLLMLTLSYPVMKGHV